MSIWGFSFTLLELAFLGILFVAFTYQFVFYLCYVTAALGNNRKEKKNKIHFNSNYLPVSVVIYARNDNDNLQKNLFFFLEQEYPAYFEVIVITENSTAETDQIISELKQKYKHLKITFVPYEIKMIIPRKLALTLGVKAATSDWVVFANIDSMPEDKHWLKQIARNFLPETDFVFAYTSIFKSKKIYNKIVTYDTFFSQAKLLGYTLRKKTVSGMASNLAMRKSVFMNNKGFKNILTLSQGDVEIIANHYARKQNTRVETTTDSVIWLNAKKSFAEWFRNRETQLFTMWQFRFTSIWRLNTEKFFRFVFYMAFVACMIFGNYITMAAAGFMFIARFITQCMTVNFSSKHFGGQRYYVSIILFDILLPLIDLYILIFRRKPKNKFS